MEVTLKPSKWYVIRQWIADNNGLISDQDSFSQEQKEAFYALERSICDAERNR